MELSVHGQSGDKHEKKKFKSDWLKYQFYKPDESDDGNVNLKTLKGKFGARTTSQGISQFHVAPKGCKKIMWAIISVAALIMLFGHIYYLCVDYAQYETTTELTVVPFRLLPFPAITICNSNAIKYERLVSPGGITRVDKYDDLPDLTQGDAFAGHSKEDLIVKATFDNQIISLDEFKHSLNPVYGSCYTFNMDDNKRTRRSFPGYGLELLLNIESYAYYNSSKYRPADWVGAVIKVHQPDLEPAVEEGGIPIAPGTLNRMAMTKTELKRLGGKYGDCIEDNKEKPETFSSGGYTMAQCENTCLQKEIIAKCCCFLKILKRNLTTFSESWSPPTDPILAELNDWDRCYRDSLQPCVDNKGCWKEIWNRYDNNTLACAECKQPCSETLYDVSTASVDWPAPNSINALVAELNRTQPHLMDIFKTYYTDANQKGIKGNLLKLQIYYERLTITKVKEVPAIGDFEFVSEFGGTLGLWIGWTVLTIFEFVEFLIDIIALWLIRKWSK